MTQRVAQFALTCLLGLAIGASPLLAQHAGGPGGGGQGGGGQAGNPGGMQHGFPGDAHPSMNPEMPTIHGFSGSHGSTHMPTHGIHSMGLAGRWWDDSHTAKSIGLSDDQRKQMDKIFEDARPAIQQRFSTVLEAQQKLNNMPSKDLADEGKVTSTIDRVTQARADLEKTTSAVFAQIRSTLTDSQRARLDDAIAKQH